MGTALPYIASSAGRRYMITEDDRARIWEAVDLDDPWVELDSGVWVNAKLITDVEPNSFA